MSASRPPEPEQHQSRQGIQKTAKLWIGGAFVRSESGRSVAQSQASQEDGVRACQSSPGDGVRACLASRKDLRNAVTAARRAQGGWERFDAYLRGQILYRAAEMLEARSDALRGALIDIAAAGEPASTPDPAAAGREVEASIDRLVAFAGWCDKYVQLCGHANPVCGPYHNTTLPQPCGVVGVVAPAAPPLLGMLSLLAPVVCGGNTTVVLSDVAHASLCTLMAEAWATADLPAGVINLLTGDRAELLPQIATHRDVDAVHAAGCDDVQRTCLEEGVADNMKRVQVRQLDVADWFATYPCQAPDWIESFQEMKTVWHPCAP